MPKKREIAVKKDLARTIESQWWRQLCAFADVENMHEIVTQQIKRNLEGPPERERKMEEKKYYIVSQKNMRRNEQIFLLWGPDFCGYTTDVDKAGTYTAEEVRAHYDCSQDFPIIEDHVWHISTKIPNFLIPADDEELKKIGLEKITVITYL